MRTDRVRRTQEQRRAETRLKLLEATTRCLLEVGYGGTTTRRVCELSGVSQGALTYNFTSRAELVSAAVEHLARARLAEMRELASGLPEGKPDRIAAMLDIVWEDVTSPTFAVFIELWVAADDDPELHARLMPIERMVGRGITSIVSDFAADILPGMPDWEHRLRLTWAACRGLALADRFEPRASRRRAPWPDLRALLLRSLYPEYF